MRRPKRTASTPRTSLVKPAKTQLEHRPKLKASSCWCRISRSRKDAKTASHRASIQTYGSSLRIREAIAENPDAYYQRGKVVRLESELQDARFDVWTTAKQVHEATRNSRHVRNTSACEKFGSQCQYFEVCAGEADINDPHKFADRESKHSELDGQESEREGTAAA